ERRRIDISGTVQGVGFRPAVWSAATKHGLGGEVRNVGGGVCVCVEGEHSTINAFLGDVLGHLPPLARVESVVSHGEPIRGDDHFLIVESVGAPGPVALPPDVAVCAECLRELLDPADRRYLYPFINCTNCGPRLTIIRGAPYDRARTTM